VPAEQVNDGRAFFRENLLERIVQRLKTGLSASSSKSGDQ
jgi:hypothetical protein